MTDDKLCEYLRLDDAGIWLPTAAARIEALVAENASLKAIMLDEDLVWNAIYDCMDYDWSSRDAARAVVRAFQKEIDGE
jgi:hypothetical protein